MLIVKDPIPHAELKALAEALFGNMVKGVVDVEKEILALGGELHADEEALLLEQGSDQRDLWGINIYPDLSGGEWIEFDSMINLRPSQDNRSRGVENQRLREKILGIVNRLVKR